MAVGRIWTDQEALAQHLAVLLAEGRRVVTANGCFELLHVGHIRYLTAARAEGDLLVVLVNSDASMAIVKPERESVVPAAERMEVLAALDAVDHVVAFDEKRPTALLDRLRPSVHTKGTDYDPKTLPERDAVESHGGRIAIVGDPKDHSVTELRRRLRARDGA